MNPPPNKPQAQRDTFQSEQRQAAPDSTAQAKLKEAEAKLLEAEAKLMDRNAVARGDAPRPLAEPRRIEQPMVRTNVTERAPSTAERASERAKEHTPSKPPTEQLSENVAGMLCYLFGWLTGIIFLLVDRRPFVRFHAAQSVAVFATISILMLVLSGFFLGALLPGIGGALLLLRRLLELTWLVATVVLMLKAAGGERFRVGFAGQYADRAAHGSR